MQGFTVTAAYGQFSNLHFCCWMPRRMLDNPFLKYIWTNFYIKTSNHLLRMPSNRLLPTLPKLNFYIDSYLSETVNIRERYWLNLNEKKLHTIPRYARWKKRYIKNIFCHIPNMNLLLRQMSVVCKCPGLAYILPTLAWTQNTSTSFRVLNFEDFRWGAKFSLTLRKPNF